MNGSPIAAACFLLPAMILGAADIQSLTPAEAAEMAKSPGCYIVDVRSIAEYRLIGHPVSAHCVPITFWNERRQSFEPNPDFIRDIEERFKTSDVLIFICRSGGRSQRAAEQAFRAGFPKVFNIKEGFEGQPDERGYRTVGGWKNSGLPYTYEVNPDQAYRFR
jgi:rhodanese-related sulfurtransferase